MPDPLAGVKRLPSSMMAIAFALATLLVLVIINELVFHRASQNLGGLGQRSEARAKLNFMLQRILDAETGQRGYLLTSRKEYLEPYETAAADTRGALEWLQRYYADDPRSRGVIETLARDVSAKLGELSTTLDLFNQGNAQGWRDILLTDIGREKMEQVRAGAEGLLAQEARRVVMQREQLSRALWIGRIGIDVVLLVCLYTLWRYARQQLAVDRERRAHAQALAAERDRLEVQVVHRTTELTQLTQHLQTAREDERSRLARELHDELGALLTAAKLDAARLKRGLPQMSPEAAQRFAHLVASLDQVVALKRRIIEDLRPSSLSHLGLVAALEILAREFSARAEVKVKTDLQSVALADSAQITVYRLVQECFTNVAKYSHAKHVQVVLEPEDDQAHICVSDDGDGFELANMRPGAHGLTGMRFRVESEGGRLRIDSSKGRGTRIEAWLPLRVHAAA